jgi:hypothetical protein
MQPSLSRRTVAILALAAVLLASASPVFAYRPFISTDAAVRARRRSRSSSGI